MGRDCTGTLCGYGVTRSVGCTSGDGSCRAVKMLRAKSSDFHDQYLQDATRDIIAALDAIPLDSRGRELSFLHTNMGTLLAWVEHPEYLPAGAVTAKDDDAKLAEALGLILDEEQTNQKSF